MWHEISRESIPIATVEGTDMAWHNDILAVRIPKGIQLFEFTFDIESYEKKLNWRTSLIRASKYSPTANLIPKSYLKGEASNIELTQIILDPGLWPQNPVLEEITGIRYFEWSPIGVIYNNQSVIAVLTIIGGVEIYARRRNNWDSKLNISMIIRNKTLPSNHIAAPSFEENLQVIKSLETTAICWGPKLEDGSCYFVSAQRNSKILIWKVQFQPECKGEIICEIPTEFGEVASLLWIPRFNNNFSLICSNKMGEIFCMDCTATEDIKVNSCVTLWPHKDRMVAKYFKHAVVGDNIIIFSHKHRHLVALVIDEKSNVVSQVTKNVNDYRITSISSKNNEFYLTTINSKIYKINFEIQDQIVLDLSTVEVKDLYLTYEFYSLSASTNGVIWAVGMTDRKIKHRKAQLTLDIVFLAPELQSQIELDVILENPSNSLTNFWDCIELIRYKAMKLKVLPSIDYNQLYKEAIHNHYKLKIYRIFVTLHNAFVQIIRDGSKGLLPETSVEVINDQLLASNAVSTMNKLCETCHRKPKLLSQLQQESFAGSRQFLEYFCRKYRMNIEELMDPSVINLVNLKVQYICQGCDSELQGFSCENGHRNTFCSKTFTLIESDDYIVCPGCDSIARIELYETGSSCIFCDLYLNNYQLPS